MQDHASRLRTLYDDALRGGLTRRQVLMRAAMLGLSAPAIGALLTACGGGGAASGPTATSGSPDTTPSGSPEDVASGRGAGGALRLLWWQAPTVLNPHFSQGTKDFDAARVVLEPLADFDAEGNLVPILAETIPSLDNGGVASDGTSITWRLKEGVTWSDGEPFTSEDVKFTYDFVIAPDAATTTVGNYQSIAAIDIPDPQTVVITFNEPTPGWYTAFCGIYGMILPQHVLADFTGSNARNAPFNLKPIGTGAYVVDDFAPGDHVDYSVNPQYREADKPFFQTVNLKGGGDATSAARASIQTGEADYAWNLQVPANVLTSLQEGGTGQLIIYPGVNVERILINFTDPNTEVNGERSHLGTPHPFQADLNVRRAYALAVQRDVIANELYGPAGVTTANLLVAPPRFTSQNTSWEYDLAGAGQLLDEAGWTRGPDGLRARGGILMQIVYQTTVNPLRQQEQEIVKASLEQLGIRVELKAVESGVFFSSDAGNPDTAAHFYADIEMFTNGPTTPYPTDYMVSWWGDPSNICQKENQWSGSNYERWQNAEYDAAYQQARVELDPDRQAELFIRMNDLVVNEVVEIALVARNGVSGAAMDLANLNLSPWTSELWNIANWVRST